MGSRYDEDPLFKAAVDASDNGRFTDSIQMWSQLTQRDSGNPLFFWCLGLEYNKVDKWTNAIGAFKSAINLDERCVPAWSGLGLSYIELKQLFNARDAFYKALRYDSNVCDHVLLASVLVELLTAAQ